MANYDSKLGEWFKLVEQQEQELKAKKHTDASPQYHEPPPAAPPQQVVEKIEVQAPVAQAPASVVAAVAEPEVVADDRMLVEASAIVLPDEVAPDIEDESDLSLFDDGEAPPVEDFLSFLNRTREPEPIDADSPFEVPRDQGSLRLPSEGTGEPRPIGDASEDMPAMGGEQEFTLPPSRRLVPPPAIVKPEAVAQPAPPVAQPELPVVSADSVQESWDRVPRHLQTLFGAAGEEVAQHSYKTFKETRGDLIQRLLDPVVSLEEAARVLNVCPTTVRRYTNRGVLKHLRTAGNQRRFRLSDVLTFMEKSGKTEAVEE